jgi:predicted transcriptional regulator
MKYIPKASVAEQLTIKTSKKRAEERLSNVEPNEMKVLDEMQAFIAYLEGGSVEEISEHFEINVDTFKYKLKKLKARGI